MTITTDSPHSWTMDADTYDKLPDRASITGIPMTNTPYRDSGEPGFIFRFYAKKGDASISQWERYVQRVPAP